MSDAFDSELRMAVAEGLLTREEAESLREEALRLGRPPLELLVERGRLSEDSLASLRKESQEQTGPTQNPADDTITVQRPSRELPVLAATDFPVPGWERYQFMRLLGQGGMGQVFLAHDPRLRRDVALKFVRGDDPDAARRFVFEARAQARVVHERVCQVYEVGEVQGKPFIAMQYIDGLPLNHFVKLTPEQKAMVLRDAAEGVHAAHRVGLVHRDLKPSNIMVERTQDGSLKPYVMDFGLARDWKEGVTASGSVLGTPHYMAPEQARGEVTRLDRRADVYSLGATLYHLLTGTYPVQGSNHLEVLSNIPSVEPRPPRALDKDIPADLEAIVLKCLEKERSARYDSARALAEDLDRFLNGEPVRARSAGLWYRLRKKARRHRAAVAMGSVALALVTLAVGHALLTRREATQREQQVRRFTAKVKDIEGRELISHLSPPHDIRADHAAIQAWTQELETWLREAGEQGQGPGHYALGQGYLSLGNKEKAREHLETAWKLGYQESHAAYALVQVLGQLYQERLLEVEHQFQQQRGKAEPGDTSPQHWREQHKQRLEQELLEPARTHLRALQQRRDAPVPHVYVEALLSFYEGHLDEALMRLELLGEGPSWFYAAPRLQGDIFLALATRHWDQGDYPRARAAFADGRRAYQRAADIARSDPSLHHAMAQLERASVEMEYYSHGDIQPHVERGLQAVERALTVAPHHYPTRVLEAQLYRRLATYRAPQGAQVQPPLVYLDKALAAARAALALEPHRPEAKLELGRLFWQWGQLLKERREDPREKLREAIDAIAGLAPEGRDGHDVSMLRGLVYKTWADYEQLTDKDPLPRVDKVIESYRKAIELDGKEVPAWVGLASAYLMRALLPNSPAPEGDLDEALKTVHQAQALNPHYVLPYTYEARAYTHLARRRGEQGGDGRPELKKSIEQYRKGLAINGELPYLHANMGLSLIDLAGEEWNQGGDPLPSLEQAREPLEKAVQLTPERFSAHHNLGWLHLRHAELLHALGRAPGPSVSAAEQSFRRALELTDNVSTRIHLGRLYYTLAASELAQGRDPQRSLRLAAKELGHPRVLESRDFEGPLFRARVLELPDPVEAPEGTGPRRGLPGSGAELPPGPGPAPRESGHAAGPRPPLPGMGHLEEGAGTGVRRGAEAGTPSGRGAAEAARSLAGGARPACQPPRPPGGGFSPTGTARTKAPGPGRSHPGPGGQPSSQTRLGTPAAARAPPVGRAALSPRVTTRR
ncbi:protein kinase domain-containing protein [Archangium gephyra]|uniref:protein kinase domain-containing protein n=1 Tax=Archangium gephyra TaxID=48 RepID=UPI003B7CAF54